LVELRSLALGHAEGGTVSPLHDQLG
jgi:hypothetical protein